MVRACQEGLEEIGAKELLDALNDAITFGEGTTFYVRVYKLYDLEPILKALHDENKIFYLDGAVSLNKCA